MGNVSNKVVDARESKFPNALPMEVLKRIPEEDNSMGLHNKILGKCLDENIDSVVQSVLKQFVERAMFGKKKYGTTLDREDLTFKEWIQHAQEELMDAILYLEKMKKMLSVEEVKVDLSEEKSSVIDCIAPQDKKAES